MPTTRRRVHRNRVIFNSLSDIPKLELIHWATYGPSIPEDYATWDEWLEVYKAVRSEWLQTFADRRAQQLQHPLLAAHLAEPDPLEVPVAEEVYQAILRGEDPDEAQDAINAVRLVYWHTLVDRLGK